MREFKTTEEIAVPTRLIDQIIGQNKAVDIMQKAAAQKRHALLIGPPGTGKSMLAQAMAELLPREEVADVMAYPNPNNENEPLVRVVKTYPDYTDLKQHPEWAQYYAPRELALVKKHTEEKKTEMLPDLLKTGLGRRIVTARKLAGEERAMPSGALLFLLALLMLWVVLFAEIESNAKWMIVAVALGLGFLIILSNATVGLNRRLNPFEQNHPKLIVDNTGRKTAPFIDATGARSGALLGDCKHDPLQSFFYHTKINLANGNANDPIDLEMGEWVDDLLLKYPESIERNEEGYEGLFLPENERWEVMGLENDAAKPVRIRCVNRHPYKGKLKILKYDSGSLMVTPEHKVYANGSWLEARALRGTERILFYEQQAIPSGRQWTLAKKVQEILISDAGEIEFSGSVYNITTESGNLFANGILVSNSGGLGTPPHLRVESGAVHKSNKGVLFIDEIASLKIHWQQELLTAMQEKRYAITGQSEMSSGALVKTEPAPTDFVLVAAGNLPDLQQLHPALRSRIRGGGYEIYVEDSMEDSEENENRLVQFVAQEVKKDGRIPHFSREAVVDIMEEGRRLSSRRKRFTLNLRELGGLVRAAGDIARGRKSPYVEREHVREAKTIFNPIENQLGKKIIELKKEYQTIIIEGAEVGRVNGLAVLGESMSGLVLPIVAEITPPASKEEGKVIATGKLGTIAKEAVENVSAIIKKYIGVEIAQKDIHIQFLQTYEGLEGDSASISVAVAVLSAMTGIKVKQNYGMTGSLDVRGEVLPVGGINAKIEAAMESNLEGVILPATNAGDVYLSEEKKKKIQVIPVKNILDVLQYALEESPAKKKLLEKMKKQFR